MSITFSQSLVNLKHVKFRSEPSQHTLFLDPVERIIYSIETTEGVIPESLKPDDLCIVTVHNPIQESLVETLVQAEKAIGTLFEYYSDEGWHVETGTYLSKLRLEIIYSIAFWWRPGYWFMESMDQLQIMWANGHSAKKIVESQYLGQYMNGMCDESEAVEWLTGKFEEWGSHPEWTTNEEQGTLPPF